MPHSPGVPVDVPTGKALVGHVKVHEEVSFLSAKMEESFKEAEHPSKEQGSRQRKAMQTAVCPPAAILPQEESNSPSLTTGKAAQNLQLPTPHQNSS